ncbi:MAG: polysaccharide deacetylase family protein [Acidobacteriota bacterium]|nr:polysaccharide deacetylase family protein [Acidobacteriota bacterium]
MKRFVILALSLVGYLGSRTLNILRQLVARPGNTTWVILYYHDITSAQRARFVNQLNLLLRYCLPVPADYAGPFYPGKCYCSITFDDAYETLLENAIPELIKRQIPATVFAIAARAGESPGWTGYSGRFMSYAQLQHLPRDLVTIGSHTLTHPKLTLLADDMASREITESRHVLEARLKRPVTLFSFPHGAFTESHVEACRDAGYERVFTIVPHMALRAPGEYVIGRVWTDPGDWDLEFKLKLFGAYRWLPYAYKLKAWMKKRAARLPRRSSRQGMPNMSASEHAEVEPEA